MPSAESPRNNVTARPYRGLSVQRYPDPEDSAGLIRWVRSRDVYRRTRYLVAHDGARATLVEVTPADGPGLFAPVRQARVLAEPLELLWIHSPETDVGNPTALAALAMAHRRPGLRAFVVTGRYQHVNFLLDPAPVRLYVDEVVPPDRPKLVEMVRQVIAFDEELPPTRIVARLLSLPMLRHRTSGRTLLPCAGAGNGEGADFLDAGPVERRDWTLIGCTRSEQIYRHHYGASPERVLDICPERRGGIGASARITKCCLLERGCAVSGSTATVPWGANLDEVRRAVRAVLLP